MVNMHAQPMQLGASSSGTHGGGLSTAARYKYSASRPSVSTGRLSGEPLAMFSRVGSD